MNKVLKNIHWLIIAYAMYSFYLLFMESEEKLLNLQSLEEGQRIELMKSKKTAREIENYYKNIKEEKDKIERVASEIDRMQQLLPGEISDTENINALRRMADDVNIKELSISPGQDQDRGFYISRKYQIKAKATFLQFLIMFEKISENKRILNVGESVFRKLAEPQRGKFQIIEGEFNIEAFKYNANYKENRGIDEIEKKFQEGAAPSPENAVKAEGL